MPAACLFPAHSYGYDPLGLGKDKETVEKYRANELIHARWAMLAAAGIIIPEGLQVGQDWLGVEFGLISQLDGGGHGEVVGLKRYDMWGGRNCHRRGPAGEHSWTWV